MLVRRDFVAVGGEVSLQEEDNHHSQHSRKSKTCMNVFARFGQQVKQGRTQEGAGCQAEIDLELRVPGPETKGKGGASQG
jgi:hypothetical protein